MWCVEFFLYSYRLRLQQQSQHIEVKVRHIFENQVEEVPPLEDLYQLKFLASFQSMYIKYRKYFILYD